MRLRASGAAAHARRRGARGSSAAGRRGDRAVRAELGDDLGDLGVDVVVARALAPPRPGGAVLHEVQLADPIDVDRRHRLAPPLRSRSAPSGARHARRWGGSGGRTRARGRRCPRSSRARSSAARGGARRAAERGKTSSKGRMTFTSLGSPRRRAASRATARRRRGRRSRTGRRRWGWRRGACASRYSSAGGHRPGRRRQRAGDRRGVGSGWGLARLRDDPDVGLRRLPPSG